MPADEIRDHETGLVSGPFSWFQSRQLFHETHEAEANSISYVTRSFVTTYDGNSPNDVIDHFHFI